MRAVLLLILSASTLYVAGIYHAPGGLFAGAAEFVLFCAMWISSRLMRRRVEGTIVPERFGTHRGGALPCRLTLRNRGRWPVWCWDACVVWRQGDHKSKCRLTGQMEGMGETAAEFDISAEHCGFVEMDLKRLRVWDHMHLFHGKVRQGGKRPALKIPVFPPLNVLRVESAQGETIQATGSDQTALPMVGNDVREVQQYRPYGSGDSVKDIHWKLSARSEDYWVKEYSRAEEHRVGLFLDLVAREPVDEERADAFYEIFLALLLGMLDRYESVYLYWFDWAGKELVTHRVTGEEEYREILVRLYEAGFIPAADVDEKAYQDEKRARLGSSLLQLDADLRLSYGNAGELLLNRFSEQNYRREIAEQKVVIP